MPDWQDKLHDDFAVRGTLKNGVFNPQVIFARDFMATANVIAPQLEWNFSNVLKFTFGLNYKFGSSGNYSFDDCRSCNPYPPLQGLQALSANRQVCPVSSRWRIPRRPDWRRV